MIMKRLALIFILISTAAFWSCKPDDIVYTYDSVDGFVQKGPFLNGTSITLSELNANLNPTGRNFTSQIADNLGSFEITNVGLSSTYVMLRADGFYFDEVQNTNSASQLTLYALADLSEATALNVNVLSDLEKSRVDYLLSTGSSFKEAKSQAQTEILSTFEIHVDGMPVSEQLDISKSGDFNAILLAISVIVQGYLPVSDVSELLANFNTDFRNDGQLNSASMGTLLVNNARAIKPAWERMFRFLISKNMSLSLLRIPILKPPDSSSIRKRGNMGSTFSIRPKRNTRWAPVP